MKFPCMVDAESWFKEWFNSPYYHQLYFDRDDNEASSFISQLIDHLSPPPASLMLDIACGKGRHSKLLSEKGFDVTGIDLSFDSINEALGFQNETLHFYQHDMRLPFRINYFDYAFNFFTSFGYFKTEREHYNAIRTIALSLKPGGTLVLDYLNVQYAEAHLVASTEKKLGDVTFNITKWMDEKHFYKKIVIEDENRDEPITYLEKVAKFTLEDFKKMFSFHGLQVQEVQGDYHLSPYDSTKSPRMIMIARK